MLLYCNEPNSPIKAVKNIAKALSENKLDPETIMANNKLITEIKTKKFKNPIEPFSLEKAAQVIGHKDHKNFGVLRELLLI